MATTTQKDDRGYTNKAAVTDAANASNQLAQQTLQLKSQEFGQPGTSKTSSKAPTEEIFSQQNMPPEALAILNTLMATLQGGGTAQQRAEVARKKQAQDLIQGMLGQFSTTKAFEDAKGLMALNLQRALEENMPAIQRAVEGAGTSASSMQGLLSQNMSRDAALAASALGAEQASKYGGITAGLTGQLGQLASQVMDPATEALLKALDISRNAVVSGKRVTAGGTTTESIGGAPMSLSASMFKSPTIMSSVQSEDPITQLSNAISGRGSDNVYGTIGYGNIYNPGQSISNFLKSTGAYDNAGA